MHIFRFSSPSSHYPSDLRRNLSCKHPLAKRLLSSIPPTWATGNFLFSLFQSLPLSGCHCPSPTWIFIHFLCEFFCHLSSLRGSTAEWLKGGMGSDVRPIWGPVLESRLNLCFLSLPICDCWHSYDNRYAQIQKVISTGLPHVFLTNINGGSYCLTRNFPSNLPFSFSFFVLLLFCETIGSMHCYLNKNNNHQLNGY